MQNLKKSGILSPWNKLGKSLKNEEFRTGLNTLSASIEDCIFFSSLSMYTNFLGAIKCFAGVEKERGSVHLPLLNWAVQ